jgi:primosomal protein N'
MPIPLSARPPPPRLKYVYPPFNRLIVVKAEAQASSRLLLN